MFLTRILIALVRPRLRHLMTSVTSADGEVGLASTNDGAGRVAITHADEAAHKVRAW